MGEQLPLGLDNLAVFAAVVDAGGFTAAANQLGLRKSAVSRRIAQLEERLGAQLLHRTTRRLRLTEIGATYYRHCAAAMAEVREAERLVAASRRDPRGTLRITTTQPIAERTLAPAVNRFLSLYPRANIAVEMSKQSMDLIGEGFDLAIRVGPLPESSALRSRTLGRIRPCYCASMEYLRQAPPLRSPADLSRHHCITISAGPEPILWPFLADTDERDHAGDNAGNNADEPSTDHAQQPPRRQTILIAGRLSTNSFPLAHQAVLAGGGVARLPYPMIAADMKAGRLVRVLADFTPPSVAIQAVYVGRRGKSTLLARFLDLLEEYLASAGSGILA